jgi:hypothetical protein
MSVPNLYDPTQNSANATPARYDFNVAYYDSEVQGRYMYNQFVSRMVAQKTIPDGSIEARFKKTGRIGTAKHNLGDSFYGMDRQQTFRSIFLDDRPEWTGIEEEDLIDKIENDPSVRSDTVIQIADALSSWDEIETMKMIYDAALEAPQANVDDTQFFGAADWGGTPGTDTIDFGTSGQARRLPTDVTENAAGALKFLSYWDQYVVALENIGAPAMGFNAVVSPKLWQEIFKLDNVLTDSSGTNTTGQVSIFADNNINSQPLSISEYYDYNTPLRYNGLNIWKHNMFTGAARSGTGFARDHSADGNPQAETGGVNRNANDASNVSALIWHPNCIGKVNKMGPVSKIETPSRTDNQLIRSKVWIGGGVINPELATAFKKA